jgi:hypothetical protein
LVYCKKIANGKLHHLVIIVDVGINIIFSGRFEKGLQFFTIHDRRLEIQILPTKLVGNHEGLELATFPDAADAKLARLEVSFTGRYIYGVLVGIYIGEAKPIVISPFGGEIVTIKGSENGVHGVFQVLFF